MKEILTKTSLVLDISNTFLSSWKSNVIQNGQSQFVGRLFAKRLKHRNFFAGSFLSYFFTYQACKDKYLKFMVDAEQTYIQAALAYFVLVLQQKYNSDIPVVYNTYQCYRKVSRENSSTGKLFEPCKHDNKDTFLT